MLLTLSALPKPAIKLVPFSLLKEHIYINFGNSDLIHCKKGMTFLLRKEIHFTEIKLKAQYLE